MLVEFNLRLREVKWLVQNHTVNNNMEEEPFVFLFQFPRIFQSSLSPYFYPIQTCSLSFPEKKIIKFRKDYINNRSYHCHSWVLKFYIRHISREQIQKEQNFRNPKQLSMRDTWKMTQKPCPKDYAKHNVSRHDDPTKTVFYRHLVLLTMHWFTLLHSQKGYP